jgi:hypothetical protein
MELLFRKSTDAFYIYFPFSLNTRNGNDSLYSIVLHLIFSCNLFFSIYIWFLQFEINFDLKYYTLFTVFKGKKTTLFYNRSKQSIP